MKKFKIINIINFHIQNVVKKRTKIIIIISTIIFLITIGYLTYLKFYFIPLEEEALKNLFYAKQYFDKNNLTKALGEKKSKGGYLGFIDISEKYSSTKIGNFSKYYAAICYYKLGNYTESINFLKKFNTNDELLCPIKYGMIGDAFVQLKKNNEALKYYILAAHKKTNIFTTPLYYYKTAMLFYFINKLQESKKYFIKIENKYPDFFLSTNSKKILIMINNKLKNSYNIKN